MSEAVTAAGGGARPDTGPAAYSVVERRVMVTVITLMMLAAGVAWFFTYRGATGSHGGMVGGLADVGNTQTHTTSAPLFLGMWVVMMTGMMLPAVGPVVLAHHSVTRRRGEGPLASVVFVAGYLAAWAAIGVVPLLAYLWFRDLSASAADSRWLPTLAGAVLLLGGAYQFSAWKATCAKACRTPMGFVLSHDFGGGARSAWRSGLVHGAYCIGCCWALTAVLLVMGIMNLIWMAVLTLVFIAERHWDRGALLTRFVGASFLVLGALVIAFPGLLPNLAGGSERRDPAPVEVDDEHHDHHDTTRGQPGTAPIAPYLPGGR